MPSRTGKDDKIYVTQFLQFKCTIQRTPNHKFSQRPCTILIISLSEQSVFQCSSLYGVNKLGQMPANLSFQLELKLSLTDVPSV